MQDRYVGDIGDFSNNGLLRALCGTWEKPVEDLRLGIVWYLNTPTKSDANNGHGNRVDYLNVSDYNNLIYRKCDTVLYDKLQALVGASFLTRKKRNIGQIIHGCILPNETQHHVDPVPISSVNERKKWFAVALDKTAKADIIFVNPDTGLAPASVKSHHKKGSQYVFMEDLQEFAKRGQSLVIYQHLPRLKKDEEEDRSVTKWANDYRNNLQRKLDSICLPWAFRWHPVSRRVYFIVAQTTTHRQIIERQLIRFKGSLWFDKNHFDEVIIPK